MIDDVLDDLRQTIHWRVDIAERGLLDHLGTNVLETHRSVCKQSLE